MHTRRLLSTLAALAAALNLTASHAAPGDLDPSFGIDGKLITSLAGNDVGTGVAVQADGKILVVGSSTDGNPDNFAVVRYLTTGALDPDFGTAGKVTTDVGGSTDYGLRAAVQPLDQKIVVVGQVFNGSDYDFGVVRYEITGALDTTFGTGGKVITPIGNGNDSPFAAAVQTDGKIVVAGTYAGPGGNDFVVVRYLATGALDPSFGTGGIATTSIGGDDAALGLVVQVDGKVVAAGYSNTGTDYDVAVVRFTAAGVLDASFGDGGIVTTPIGNGNDFGASVALGSGGTILVAGSTSAGANSDFALVRYTSGGALDTSFNGTGKVTTAIGNGDDNAQAVAVQSDGKIVLAGFAQNGGVSDFALARYHADGTLDESFHGTGKTTTDFGGNDVGGSMALQGDGKIVVAGYSNAAGGGVNDFAVARYQVETTPGDIDSLVADVSGAIVIGSAQQPDGKTIIIGVFTSVNGVPRNNIARLNADGSLDTGFDPNTSSQDPAAGRVNGVAVLPDEKIVISGYFTALQPNNASSPTARNYVARLNADGTLDASFDLQVDGVVYGLAARPDGKLLMWGVFNSVLGTARHNVARLNANGTLDASFNPNPNDFIFGAAVQDDGKVLLGGGFTSLDPNAAGSPISRRYFARVNDDGTVDPGFDPSPNVRVFATRAQPDGKVLLSGDFNALQPNGGAVTPRNHIARVNADGTLDSFDPDAPIYETNSIALQADGKVIFTGGFDTVQGTPRNHVARVDASGTLDANFDPNLNNGALSVTLQDDGKVQLGGAFTTLQPNGAASPVPRSFFARVFNDPATQTLTAPDATQVSWQRGGSTTELTGVTFEKSLDDGATWTPLGIGTRVGATANWQLTSLSLDGQIGKLRARGFTAGGYFNGCSGLVEQTTGFNFTTGITATPTLTAPATDSFVNNSITVTFTLPEAALSGSVKVKFVRADDGTLTRTLTLAASQETAGTHTFTFDPANPVASSGGAVVSIAPVSSTIPDLVYHVTLSYQDATGSPLASVTHTNVTVDTITQSPALLSYPQDDGVLGGQVTLSNFRSALNLNLPENAAPGSVVFTFKKGADEYVFTTTAAVAKKGSNFIIFSPTDPIGTGRLVFDGTNAVNLTAFATGPASIPDGGPYAVSYTYYDLAGNSPVTSNVATNVTVDTVTTTPTLTAPQGLTGSPINVDFMLPEEALAGSPKLIFTGTVTRTLFLSEALGTAGQHTFSFDPANPQTASDYVVGGSAIPDGTYTVKLAYRDFVSNAEAVSATTSVTIDTVLAAPTLTAPSGLSKSPIDVAFSLPESAKAGTVKLHFGSTTFTLASSQETAGAHSFSFPANDPTSAAQIASGAPLSDGTYAVTLTYQDILGNTATSSESSLTLDTVAAAITVTNPNPAIVAAGPLPDYRGQVTTDGSETISGYVQSPAQGATVGVGSQTVTITGHDAAGNLTSTQFAIVVRPAIAPSEVKFAKGKPAPGAGGLSGLPGSATMVTFGAPAIDDDGRLAFVGKYTSSVGKGTALFTDSACLARVGGNALGASPGIYKSFSDPVIDGGQVVTIASMNGVPKAGAAAVLRFDAGGVSDIVARTGEVAPDQDGNTPILGAKFKAFKGISIRDGAVAVFAQLSGGTGPEKGTPATDFGLWIKDGTNPLKLVFREGKSTVEIAQDDVRTIKTLVSFATGNGSPGQGRGWLTQAYGPTATALLTFTDKSQAVVIGFAGGFAQLLSLSGVSGGNGPVIPNVPTATFASYSFPASTDDYSAAFLASLTPSGGDITKANARGIFVTGSNGYVPLARVGTDSGINNGAKFSVLKDPVYARDHSVAFPATIKGGTAKGLAATTLWWRKGNDGDLTLLAQAGTAGGAPNDLPDGARWKSFPSLAIADNRGPLFSATLVPNKGGVKAADASGVWAMDFTGKLRTLFRTNDVLDLGNGVTRHVQSFSLLKATVGSKGVTRSFNATQKVVWLATFKEDKSQAIITTDVP